MNLRKRLLVLAPALGLILVALPLLAAPLRAADDVSERSVDGFERVRVTGAFTTKITAGAPQTRVVVRGDRDLIDRVTTRVTDGTLIVGMTSGTSWFKRLPTVDIALPALRGFVNEGAGSVDISGVHGSDFAITNAGAASIVAAGRVDREAISLDGTGKVDATAVEAHNVTVDNNGVGSVRVRASGVLTAAVNGVGEIRYVGKPTRVDSQVNGIGRVSAL